MNKELAALSVVVLFLAGVVAAAVPRPGALHFR